MKRLFLLLPLLFVSCSSERSKTEIKDGFISGAEGLDIYYQIMGSGQDTIVVIHGGPGAGMNSILPSVKPLDKSFKLILYDQRGGGRSGLPADTTKLQPQYFVEDLEAVRQHFGLRQMNVLTHSFGSVLVSQYALKYPEHLKRIVFHGATGPDLEQELQLRGLKAKQNTTLADSSLLNRSSVLLNELLNGTASDPVSACKEYEELNKKIVLLQGDPVNYKGTTCDAPSESVYYYYRYTAQLAPRYYNGWNFTTGLEQVTAPLLVVYGESDSLMMPAQRSWVDAVPDGRLLSVPNAGKSALSDNPEFTLTAITEFMNGEWPDEAK